MAAERDDCEAAAVAVAARLLRGWYPNRRGTLRPWWSRSMCWVGNEYRPRHEPMTDAECRIIAAAEVHDFGREDARPEVGS